ncbi:MAG: 4-hydroxy-3-methylbut-2-enyl diphosphate reductase [Bacteroidetes bacterium]|nr:MAG: 4-hydroxy-3-methylbut-2-enyl diphosphate reductase [Bacteroidota bacterium]
MYVEIDKHSGFCFGVVRAIRVVEQELLKEDKLFCIGDIVHNRVEVGRLEKLGVKVIVHEDLERLQGKKVFIRAHGEHPSTYEKASRYHIDLIDATCPVVLQLQKKIRRAYEKMKTIGGQIVIFGKPNHPEVNGLWGQTRDEGIIVSSIGDLDRIDFSRPVSLFVQTTKSEDEFHAIRDEIGRRMRALSPEDPPLFDVTNSICREMSSRVPALQNFVERFEAVLFVSGKKSSNGKFLFSKCREINEKTYFISCKDEMKGAWFEGVESVGVCGATSTPMWLMEEIAREVQEMVD